MVDKPATKIDILNAVYDNTNDRINVNADLEVSDIQIGAVEIKDGDSNNRGKVDTNGSQQVTIAHSNGELISQETYLNVDGRSVYPQDVDFSNSDFTGWTGDPTNLFKSPFSASITNSSSDNPKSFTVAFNRTIKTLQIGLGENNGGNFSNIKITLLGSAGFERTLYDESTDNTKRTSLNVEFNNELFNSLKIEFFTTDSVSLSNFAIEKAVYGTSQIEGRTDAGQFVPFGATNSGNFKVAINEYGDTPSVDAFARLRVSDNFTIFDSKQLHDKQPLFWDEAIGGSATSVHIPADAATRMTLTASTSDYVIRQTKQRFNYQPGKSQLILMTYYSPQESGTTKRIGIFDDDGTGNNLTPNNGIFFETDGDLYWNIAKNGTITERVAQSDWNVDPLDGTGPSRLTYNPNSSQILIIDYEWLGVGRVRVGFVIDGLIYYVHYFNHANNPSFTNVYMSTPNLPLRYSVETDGTNPATLDHICSTVISEGGTQKTGILRTVNTDFNHINASSANTNYVILGIRLKDAYKDVTVIPESLSIINENNDDFKWSLYLNPIVNGTFNYTDLPNSAIQKAKGATNGSNTITIGNEGLEISSGYASIDTLSTNEQLQTALRLGSTIVGTQDELVLAVTPLSGGADIHGSLNFRELL